MRHSLLWERLQSRWGGTPGVTHLSVTEATPLTVKSGKECTPIGVLAGGSRRIPVTPIPPIIRHDDPAGAKPRRDHRFLARRSRHEVPMTPGKKPQEINDPGRVSHFSVNQCDPYRGRGDRGDPSVSRSLRGFAPRHPGYLC